MVTTRLFAQSFTRSIIVAMRYTLWPYWLPRSRYPLHSGDHCGGVLEYPSSMPRMLLYGPREAPSYVRLETF
jgi:hypothetical protein